MFRIFDHIDQHLLPSLKRTLAEESRQQVMRGAPSSADETGLRRFAQQLRDNKVVVKLFLRHPLHVKLYLLFRDDYNNPITGYVDSRNLTFAGLSHQGELNLDQSGSRVILLTATPYNLPPSCFFNFSFCLSLRLQNSAGVAPLNDRVIDQLY